jgi:peptide/nickel transport system substrate-binding protein
VTTLGRPPGLRRRVLGGTALIALLAAGCGASAPGITPVTYVGVRGGNISIGVSQAPTGCNPHTLAGDTAGTRLILGAVLPSPFFVNASGATSANPNLIVQSELVSTKPETIIYTLNPKAVWSDGVPITATDFIYAWDQQKSTSPLDPNGVSSTQGYKDISSVEGSNRGHTVTVKFKTPYADWQMLFANLLPAHVMEKVGWNPSCTTVDPRIDVSGGPFEIASMSAQTITLRDNPKWWGVVANANALTVHFASSTNQLAQWMRNGDIQVAQPGTLSPSFLTQMASLPGVQSSVQLSSTLLQLEMASGPDTHLSPDMRFAVALSVDRNALVNSGAAWAVPGVQVANSHVFVQGQSDYHAPPSQPVDASTTSTPTSTTLIGAGGSVDFPTTPVLDQAQALMTASGFERTNGSPWHSDFGVPLTLHVVVDEGDPWAAAAAPMIRDQLQDAGFAVSLYPAPDAPTAGEILAHGFADLALLPRVSGPFTSQVLTWYSPVAGAPGQNGSQDWSGFDNAALTGLLVTASQQLNPDTAATGYEQADMALWDNMVALPLFAEPSGLIWNRTIGGVQQTPRSDNLLWNAQLWAVRVPESTNNTTPALPGQ